MWQWIKLNPGTVILAVMALWILSNRFGWLQKPIPDDPTAPIKHFTAATWKAEVLDSEKPVLVDFWAAWCGPCRMQGPIVSDLSKQVSATAVVGKVDVDKEGELASRYNISGIPALLIFKKGQVVKSFTGLTSGSTLKNALEEAGR